MLRGCAEYFYSIFGMYTTHTGLFLISKHTIEYLIYNFK
jgi:hypothetical protein